MEDYAGFEPQVGEILALRTFRIGPDSRLYPLFSDRPWTDGPNVAVCNRSAAVDELGDGRAHSAPNAECTCGFYAYGSTPAAGEYPHARYVLAVVACWGQVIAGTRGIRAGQARIEALWFSASVPADLSSGVRARYPATAVYADQAEMLAAHPPTVLDCYELADLTPEGARARVALRLAVGAALVIGSLPRTVIWQNLDVRAAWAVAVCFFIGAAIVRARSHRDLRRGGRTLLYVAVALWLIAPFGGASGLLFLRLPLLEVASVGIIQRLRLNREARRFPARIAGLSG
jgi:hypothetical protein